jgi:ElaA protein
MGYENGKLLAYLRAFPPGVKCDEASLGRVLVMKEARTRSLGKELTKTGLDKIQMTFGNVRIKISAQSYLLKFYSDFGFKAVSETYLEEGIPHIKMLRNFVNGIQN